MKYSEIYALYFETTWGRFYNEAQRARLLTLFAATRGVAKDDPALEGIRSAIAQVEENEPTGLIDCRNLILLATVAEADEQLHVALRELRLYLERCAREQTPMYRDIRDWHIKVYDARHGSTREQAFIAYGSGDVDDAVALLERLSGDLTAKECLAVIYNEQKQADGAYYHMMGLLRMYREVLHLEAPEWLRTAAAQLGEQLEPAIKQSIEERAGVGARGGKCPMGFTAE